MKLKVDINTEIILMKGDKLSCFSVVAPIKVVTSYECFGEAA